MLSTSESLVRMLTTRQLSVYLKSDQAKAAPPEGMGRDAADSMRSSECILKDIYALIVRQGRAVDGFTLMNLLFLPLNFCATVFCLPSAI